MAYFFFHHPLNSRCPIPGRYPFDCTGRLVDAVGNAHIGKEFQVAADGYGPNRPGSNVDPCPFAAPLTLIHSFCGLDRRGGKFYVQGTKKNLASVVRCGDTVIYGCLTTSRGRLLRLFVDTILVVEETPDLATVPGGVPHKRFRFIMGAAFARSVVTQTGDVRRGLWARFQRTDAWRMNLQDAASGCRHEHTAFNPHRIIVGQACTPGTEHLALTNRTTSYLPLVAHYPCGTRLPVFTESNVSSTLWHQLSAWIEKNPQLSHAIKPPTRMSKRLGAGIYDELRRISGSGGPLQGFVALPPLRWLNRANVIGAARSGVKAD